MVGAFPARQAVGATHGCKMICAFSTGEIVGAAQEREVVGAFSTRQTVGAVNRLTTDLIAGNGAENKHQRDRHTSHTKAEQIGIGFHKIFLD